MQNVKQNARNMRQSAKRRSKMREQENVESAKDDVDDAKRVLVQGGTGKSKKVCGRCTVRQLINNRYDSRANATNRYRALLRRATLALP